MMYFASVSRTAFDSRSDSNVMPLARSDRHASSNAMTRMRTSSGLKTPPAYLSMASSITCPAGSYSASHYDVCSCSHSVARQHTPLQLRRIEMSDDRDAQQAAKHDARQIAAWPREVCSETRSHWI